MTFNPDLKEYVDYPLDLALEDILRDNNLKPIKLNVNFGKEYRHEYYRKDDHLYIVKRDYSLRIKPNYFKKYKDIYNGE